MHAPEGAGVRERRFFGQTGVLQGEHRIGENRGPLRRGRPLLQPLPLHGQRSGRGNVDELQMLEKRLAGSRTVPTLTGVRNRQGCEGQSVERAVGNEALASRLFQTALDLSDARQGALFVVLRDAATSLPLLVAPGDRLDSPRGKANEVPDRVQLLYMLRGRSAVNLDPAVLAGLARTDGATVMDGTGRLLAVGAILLHTEPLEPHSTLAVEGARTTAAMAAGRYAAVLKVSEDGLMTFYDRQEKIWDI